MRVAWLILIGVAWSLGGCGHRVGFGPSFPVNQRAALKTLAAEQARGPSAVGQETVVYLSMADQPGIVAHDLKGSRAQWRIKANVKSRIALGDGALAYSTSPAEIVARSKNDGRLLWTKKLKAPRKLTGLTAFGDFVFYTSKGGADAVRYHLVAIEIRSGKETWRLGSKVALGSPVAVAGAVAVPVRRQAIAVLDATSGDELARIRSTEETLHWAHAADGQLIFGGEKTVYTLRDVAKWGAPRWEKTVAVKLPKLGAIRPAIGPHAYRGRVDYGAYDRSRVLWKLSQDSATGFAGDMVVVQHFRFLLALKQGEKRTAEDVAWAFSTARADIVGSSHQGETIVLVTSNGDVIALRASDGLELSRSRLGGVVRGAAFDLGGFRPEKSESNVGESDVAQAVDTIIRDPDRRFDAVKLFGVSALARISGMGATRVLVRLVTETKSLPMDVRRAAEEMLVQRKDPMGIPAYVAALSARYDYVRGTQPRAVSALAITLGALKAPEAAGVLLQHLADHETPLADLVPILNALRLIRSPSMIKPLSEFLLTYRCAPEFEGSDRALLLAAEILAEQGGQAERDLLAFVADQPQTLGSLRLHLSSEVLVAPAQAASQGDGKGNAAQ